jgi:AmmeMemoRadiSam system protein B
MKTGRVFSGFFVFLSIVLSQADIKAVLGEEPEDGAVREPILAGTWYPGDKNALNRSIQGYLSGVKGESSEKNIRAIIVPHAGHIYSGQVAAYAYKRLKSRDYDRVVMIGPSHRSGFKGISVNLQPGYKTPLGTVPVDQDFARKLIQASDQIRYIPNAHAKEHSLEIQLPFLQTVLEDFKIVPIVMGEQDYKTCSGLAAALVKLGRENEKTLLLASSDLSHFHGDNLARELDGKFIEHVEKFDPEGLIRSLESGMCEACGGGPVATVMLASKTLGADNVKVLKYANSGDVSGDKGSVVGYMSAVFFKD